MAKTPEQYAAQLAQQREAYAADPGRRERVRAAGAAWRAQNPERLQHKRRAYRERALVLDRARGKDITAEEVHELLAANDGTCDVCGVVIQPRKNGADGRNVDHRHDNGFVRGILCTPCNRAAAVLDRDEAFLAKLAAYCRRGAE